MRFRSLTLLLLGAASALAVPALTGCIPGAGALDQGPDRNVDGDETGDGTVEGPETFADNDLTAPQPLPTDSANVPPTGELLYPPQDAAVAGGAVAFVWRAVDEDGTNIDSTIYISEVADVFENPLVRHGLRTAPDEEEHRLSVELPLPGRFFWGLEVFDGVNTIRRPANGVGVGFDVQAAASGRVGLANAILLCPRQTQPARPVTTFQWSLGDVTPLRAQVFVGRAGRDSPFDVALRAFEVIPPTATTLTISPEDAFPIGDTLSWGLRVETADQVLFTFDGQLGESFVVADNVVPSGVLLGPEDDAVLADETETLLLSWQADPGNCEDVLTSTVFFQRLGEADEPTSLFDSPVALALRPGRLEVDLAVAVEDLGLSGGRWAWGVVASDGTDETPLPAGTESGRTFHTFVRDTAPFFEEAPAVIASVCPSNEAGRDAIAFSYMDDNGLDTVSVTVTFANTEATVFEAPVATVAMAADDNGAGVVFLQEVGAPGCVSAAHGPGIYGIELNDGVNDPVRMVLSYAGPPTGACCAVDGGCVEGLEEACTEGAYQGDGSTCDPGTCPVLIGACCAIDGGCVEDLPDACPDGTYQGDGTTCAPNVCRVLIGACCHPDGGCAEGLPEDCIVGTYEGDGTTCDTVSCPQPPPPMIDCNGNGIDDAADIGGQASFDCNGNGVPDECEDLPIIVDAGTLAPGVIGPEGLYISSELGNDLLGNVCPFAENVAVLWTFESGPLGVEVFLDNPAALSTPYTISPGVPGDYVFRLSLVDTEQSDSVTLTLTAAP